MRDGWGLDRASFVRGFTDLDALFLIATRFGDSHHPTAIQFRMLVFTVKPRLFSWRQRLLPEPRVQVLRVPSQALQLGDQLHQTIVRADIEARPRP